MIGRGIPRHGYEVYKDDKKVGVVTSGTQSPTLGKNVGLVLMDASFSALDTEVTVHIRGKNIAAKVVKTPFYKRGV